MMHTMPASRKAFGGPHSLMNNRPCHANMEGTLTQPAEGQATSLWRLFNHSQSTTGDTHIPNDMTRKPDTEINQWILLYEIDLADTYNQIKLTPVSQQKLTLHMHRGVLLQTHLPFGISSAPGYFQEIMDQLTSDLSCCLPGQLAHQWCQCRGTYPEPKRPTTTPTGQGPMLHSGEVFFHPATSGVPGLYTVMGWHFEGTQGQCHYQSANTYKHFCSTFVPGVGALYSNIIQNLLLII